MTTSAGAVPGVALVRGTSPHEDVIGYSRAVVAGGRVLVSGTTAAGPDPHAQARAALAAIGAALEAAGTDLRHVVRTRMFVVGAERCDDVGRAHAEVFGEVRPAASMLVVAGLLPPGAVVEIEVEAVLP